MRHQEDYQLSTPPGYVYEPTWWRVETETDRKSERGRKKERERQKEREREIE
jgi:hypothetical protein